MARVAALLDRILLWIGFSAILSLLLAIQSDLKREDKPVYFKEILIEKATKNNVICYDNLKDIQLLPELNYFLTTKYHTVAVGGGLGNQLFELISIIGIASELGRRPMMAATDAGLMREVVNGLLYKFPLLIEQFAVKIIEPQPFYAVVFNQKDCCRFDDVSRLRAYNNSPLLLLDGYYYQSFKYFDHLRSNIRLWLTPLPNTAHRAEQHLPRGYREDLIICTHIRRGDFTDDGVHRPSDANFTRRATDYLANKYSERNGSVTVVILGNDPLWAQSIFHDMITVVEGFPVPAAQKRLPYRVVITATLQPEVDLAFSRRFCDVVLITAPSSTFGWWLAYLSKPGSDVYYRDINETSDKVLAEMEPGDFYPPDWVKLKAFS